MPQHRINYQLIEAKFSRSEPDEAISRRRGTLNFQARPRPAAHDSTPACPTIRPQSTSSRTASVSRRRSSARATYASTASLTSHPRGRSSRSANPSSFSASSCGRCAVTTRVVMVSVTLNRSDSTVSCARVAAQPSGPAREYDAVRAPERYNSACSPRAHPPAAAVYSLSPHRPAPARPRSCVH